jgi:hypothetical protein
LAKHRETSTPPRTIEALTTLHDFAIQQSKEQPRSKAEKLKEIASKFDQELKRQGAYEALQRAADEFRRLWRLLDGPDPIGIRQLLELIRNECHVLQSPDSNPDERAKAGNRITTAIDHFEEKLVGTER